MADTGIGITEFSGICKSELCSGCGACVYICPKNCIRFEEDRFGQERPVIDQTRCTQCGMCRKNCPGNMDKKSFRNRYPQHVYAGWRNKESERRTSSSGGIASALAEYVIQHGGVVYGVIQEQERIIYQRADTVEMVRRFRGSRYVQANATGIYRQIEKDVSAEKKVLLIGTPCLIAGILSYMDRKDSKKKYQEYLITVDLLCHGTMPQRYLKEHITAICKKNTIKYDRITFRSNIPGENYKFILKKNDKVLYSRRAESDLYFYSFLSSVAVRESCINCKYKNTVRYGDITLGDFLGLGKEIPFSEKEKGVHTSLILVNSDAGKQLLENINSEICLFPRTLEKAVNGGPSLRMEDSDKKIKWMKRRKKFRILYPKAGFEEAAKKSIGDQVLLSLTKDKVKELFKR